MTEALPDPLVPAEVDLRDFPFMPLDVVRLRDSGLAAKATGDEFRAAVLLWCASWHQVPAASLPDDDAELANLCGYGRAMKEWKKVRDGALRGWVLCSDGRMYHDTVSTKARDAWQSKLAQRARTEAARRAREEQRQRQSQALSQTQKTSVTDIATESKGQGQGQGQGDSGVGAAAPPPNAAKAASTPRGNRLPADWVLPKAWGDWAIAEYPQWTPDKVRREGASFRDHWTAKTGKEATKLDWEATWRNWCRSSIAHRDDPKPGQHGGGQSPATDNADFDRLKAMEAERAARTPEQVEAARRVRETVLAGIRRPGRPAAPTQEAAP